MSDLPSKRKLVTALAVRNQGSRLYGKPLQNLHVASKKTILSNIIECLDTIKCIDQTVLGIAEGDDNITFINYAKLNKLSYIIGDETDVLARLISCAEIVNASDIFRVTSESPFPSYNFVQDAWKQHIKLDTDAIFYDEVVDGCGFEIIKLEALKKSHKNGNLKHKSELCTLYMRENPNEFNLMKFEAPVNYKRHDLRLTVDNPEDLILCKAVYKNFIDLAPRIPLDKIIEFLDMNPNLIKLIKPYTEIGYQGMYIWKDHEKKY